jgi:hypothetical protein
MVYIDHTHRIIVIENPKSGSTTLIRCLDLVLGLQIPRTLPIKIIHTTSEDAQKMYSEYWNDYLKISTIRDPFERFVSSALMRAHIARYDIQHIECGTPVDTNKMKEYFKKYKYSYCYCRPQECYTSGMDVLISVDNFQDDFDKLCDRLHFPRIIVPHLNKKQSGELVVDISIMKSIYNEIKL